MNEIIVDPDAAAQSAIRAGDWRLVTARTPNGRRLEGVRCSIAAARWSQAMRHLSIAPIVEDPAGDYRAPPDSPSHRRAAARYNALLVAAEDAPHRALCLTGGATTYDNQGGLVALEPAPRPIADWARLNALPPQQDLLGAARAGQRLQTATLPFHAALEADFFGFDPLAWAALRNDRPLLRRFAADADTRDQYCDLARRRGDPRADDEGRQDAITIYRPERCGGCAAPGGHVVAGFLPGRRSSS